MYIFILLKAYCGRLKLHALYMFGHNRAIFPAGQKQSIMRFL